MSMTPMTDEEILEALRQHRKQIIEVFEKEIDEANFNAYRYESEKDYQKMLDLKTIKYILGNL